MQALVRTARSFQGTRKLEPLKQMQIKGMNRGNNGFTRYGCVTSSPAIRQKGLENITVEEILLTKGEKNAGSWLWCRTDDTVYDAMKNMAQHNIGSLAVVKPGNEHHIAGIITERVCSFQLMANWRAKQYLKKIIGLGRSSKHTRVGEIMTEESKLITVTPDTNILRAMQLMTENHIRHTPVINGKIVGMISIVDVVRAVAEQQAGELKRLNEFIRGDYY